MKLVTYQIAKETKGRLGVLLPGEIDILDVSAVQQRVGAGENDSFSSMQELIVGGPPALDALRRLVVASNPADRVAINSAVRLLAPIPVPMQIRDCLCFEDHLVNAIDGRNAMNGLARSPDQQRRLDLFRVRPFYYKANRFAVVGTDTDVYWPSYSNAMDYELEMAAIIWRKGANIARENAGSYIFGYTIFNDFSARDTQTDEMATLGPSKSKDFDGANVFGPCIVTADEFDANNAPMTSRVNGVVQNVGHSSTMYYKFEDLIAFISQSETLHPGEILGSGTVGNGCGLELGRYLSSGDVVALEIEGIGRICNRVIRHPV
jgi:2-keto-4-pentenoate hydratase/2-oxohepta-3-ene-1,7-dioic acid hydratase in catechol pathway